MGGGRLKGCGHQEGGGSPCRVGYLVAVDCMHVCMLDVCCMYACMYEAFGCLGRQFGWQDQ